MPLENQLAEPTLQQPAHNGELAEAASASGTVATSDDSALHLDEQHLVLERLLAAHEAWFDVTRDYEYAGRGFEGYAEFHSYGEKYVLSKKRKLWEVEAHEYLFFKLVERLDEETFLDYLEFMKTEAVKKANPGPNHMTSYISLVLIAQEVERGAGRTLRKTSYHKTFKMGFHGYAELRLCVVDLAGHQVLTNAMGKSMKKALEENAGFTAPGTGKTSRR
ncbi:MAG: hypothetical protein ACI36W_02710 [Coriobacteriales bacterium]